MDNSKYLKKIIIDKDYVMESLKVGNNSFIYQQVENSFTQPNAGVNEKMLFSINERIELNRSSFPEPRPAACHQSLWRQQPSHCRDLLQGGRARAARGMRG